MTRLAVFFTSFVFLLVLTTGEADARRFGGGGSKGTFSRQMTSPKAPSQASRPAAQPKSTVANARPGGMGGMFMGLAAGGLLAALFMGGAFEGIQLFDIILIMLVIGGVAMFMRSRRTLTQPEPQPVMGNHRSTSTQDIPNLTPTSSSASASGTNFDQDSADITYGAPDWFDEKTFLDGAKNHFIAIQKAWDANDLTTIKEYVTPQLYKFLQEERAAQTDHIETKVHKLAVEMTNIQQLSSGIVELAIMFHGVINEGEPTDSNFCEIWHLIRDMNLDNAPWLIQGIEQVES
ncbi:Tim44 domain-containing protein [Marinospirillum insulare]|uniref:Tim44-like domain-containing protein n=1 Tax=Marinospirillum insulare TaxID=217169 RepID=A0ABQ6A1Q0_9GAMM|nr:TIM44-like domain-containing protein [Marinospirillum insulare]GLR65190.1 hypothetical protein GCM10007878_26290 [Marinospirillum insulare]